MTSQEKVEIRAANRRDMDIINLFGTRPGIMATQMKLAELVYQDPYAPEPRGGDLAEPTTPVDTDEGEPAVNQIKPEAANWIQSSWLPLPGLLLLHAQRMPS